MKKDYFGVIGALVFVAVVSLTSALHAGFKLPSSVYRYGEVEEAMAEAQEKGKFLAFIWTDEKST